MKILFRTGLLIIGLLLAYLLLFPTPIMPEAWTPEENTGFTGSYEKNDLLKKVTQWSTGEHLGPEDVAIDSLYRVYGGTKDGKILRFSPEGESSIFADTEGRPLGLHFDKQGNLIVADAKKGLLSIDPSGKISVLALESNGLPFKFVDDLDIGADGTIYFSDASDKYSIENYKLDLLEHGGNGRLLAYDPATKKVTTLMAGLYFANGIAVSPDQQYVLVNETAKYRITRYWIAGPKKGQNDIFAKNFPGFPDGVSTGSNGIYWVAFTAPRDQTLDKTLPKPFLRKIIARLPEFLKPQAKPYGFVLGLDQHGKVVYNLQDPDGALPQIASAQQFGDSLYLGSLAAGALGIYPLGTVQK